jgi:hypothetical protein
MNMPCVAPLRKDCGGGAGRNGMRSREIYCYRRIRSLLHSQLLHIHHHDSVSSGNTCINLLDFLCSVRYQERPEWLSQTVIPFQTRMSSSSSIAPQLPISFRSSDR